MQNKRGHPNKLCKCRLCPHHYNFTLSHIQTKRVNCYAWAFMPRPVTSLTYDFGYSWLTAFGGRVDWPVEWFGAECKLTANNALWQVCVAVCLQFSDFLADLSKNSREKLELSPSLLVKIFSNLTVFSEPLIESGSRLLFIHTQLGLRN